jgi:proteic killer suppression protein
VIRSFADDATEEVFVGIAPKSLPADILSAARRKLRYIDAATYLTDLMAPPGNKLHRLGHERTGQHAVWINAKYRICFRWQNDGVYDVEITDYH